jgi:hypothetical protein
MRGSYPKCRSSHTTTPAAEFGSATAATPALPIVETVSDDDSVLARDATCATSTDTASGTTHRPIVWSIRVVKSDVPDARPKYGYFR